MSEDAVNAINTEKGKQRETYPIKTYKSIENFVANIYKKYGDTEIVSNEKVADANNLAANSIKQLLSTTQQYSALKNYHGKGYKVTEEFTNIYHPENDEERLLLIVQCLKGVPFYKPLFNDYEDKAVPSLEGLQNRFIREYKMKNHIAKNAAEVFIQNLKDFNLLNSRSILILPTSGKNAPLEEVINKDNGSGTTPPYKPQGENGNNDNEEKVIKIPIRLKGGRMAYLNFPSDFEDEDLLKIFKVLKAYIEAYGENINLSKSE